jgi:hypothetical protein
MFAGSRNEGVVGAPMFTSLRGGTNTAGEIIKKSSIHV